MTQDGDNAISVLMTLSPSCVMLSFVEHSHACVRGEDLAKRNAASSRNGVVGSTGTKTPMQPATNEAHAPASCKDLANLLMWPPFARS